MLRVHLYNENEGQLTLDDVDPDDLGGLEIDIKRSEENDGVIYEISLPLTFYKKGRDFIQRVYENYGVEAKILMTVFDYVGDTYTWEQIGSWLIDLKQYEIDDIGVKVAASQVGFDTDFVNQTDKDVDLETVEAYNGDAIPTTPVISVEMHPKAILKTYEGYSLNPEQVWNENTIYSVDDKVKFKLPDEQLYTTYISLQNANLTKRPDLFPDFWQVTQSLTTETQNLNVFDFVIDHCPTPVGCGNEYKEKTVYGRIDFGDVISDDIDEFFDIPYGIDESFPSNIFLAAESGTLDLDISVNLKHTVIADNPDEFFVSTDTDVDGCGGDALGHLEIKAWFEHRDSNDVELQKTQIGSDWVIPNCPGFTTFVSEFEKKEISINNLNIGIGDKLYVYYTIKVFGDYSRSTDITNPVDSIVHHSFKVQAIADDTYIKLTQKTEFQPTTSKGILIYEALNKMCQYYTAQQDCFRSTFFGRTDTVIPYNEDGKYSTIMLSNGRNIRLLENKTIFANWDECIKSLNAISPIGYGFENLENGQRILRVEGKEYFWNKNAISLQIGNVSNLKKIVVFKDYKNQVEIGYPKIENINQINAIDEFNTIRRFVLALTKVNGKIDLRGRYRASGYEIESLRRLVGQTKESRLDDENFFVCLLRDGLGWITEKNENLPVLENVFDPESVYNGRISPSRNLRNWLRWVTPNILKNEDKSLKFSYGEGNYEMVSRYTDENSEYAEKEDIELDISDSPYLHEHYTFETKFTRDQYVQLKQNPYGVVTFLNENDITQEGFCMSCKWKPESKKAEFILKKVYRVSI